MVCELGQTHRTGWRQVYARVQELGRGDLGAAERPCATANQGVRLVLLGGTRESEPYITSPRRAYAHCGVGGQAGADASK
jgi:hypothetical protein